MIKLLHSADWHLDSPLRNRDPRLKEALLSVPDRVCGICRREGCQLLLLSGDIFDGPATVESIGVLRRALAEVEIPVFIAPGNHDYIAPGSPWLTEVWPENVHIFTKQHITSAFLPELNCRVYGAGFHSMDCPPLLENFSREPGEEYAIGILHGDPTQSASPCCPVTAAQVRGSGLSYLGLGHIHKYGQFLAGDTLCAWPGCPMGRGFDEAGEKGVLLVTLDENACAEFVPLDLPRFYELTVAGEPAAALEAALPAAGNGDYYRITLTGETETPNLEALSRRFERFPNLEWIDRTQPPVDIWQSAGGDNLEGLFFSMLRNSLEEQDEEGQRITCLAAKIARQLLDGKEVALP